MNYGAEYTERVKHFGERNKGDVVIPLSDLSIIYARLGKKNPAAEALATQLQEGDTGILPSELFIADGDSMALNISAYKKTGMVRRLSEVDGALSLFRDLHRDATLRGEKTVYTEGFREARRETQHRNADLTRAYISSGIDHQDQLATEGNLAHIESPEVQEAFKHIEVFAQSITDRLFAASGIKKFKPKVYLTKSETKNAFVLTQDTGNAFKEYIATATDDQPMELPIFIHTGLIRTFKTEDELAGVLAHEFAHLLQPNYIDDKDESLQKRLEYDADAQGMRLADAAGFNPRGLIDVMKTFNRGMGSALDIILGSTHPATEKRIIELEKLFHRTDVPLPNAAKSMTPYSEQLTASLDATKKVRRLEKRRLPIMELEQEGKLDESLKNVDADPAIFFDMYNSQPVEAVAATRVVEAYRDYELATGECGYRDHLLQLLDTFLIAIKKIRADGLDISVEIPSVGNDILDIPMPNPEEITFTTLDNIASHRIPDHQERWRRESFDFISSRIGMDPVEPPLRTLEQWISDDGDTTIFWEEVQKKFHLQKPLTRGQKLFCLRSWLKDSNPSYGDYKKFKLTKTVEEVERTPIMPDLSTVSVLDNVPLVGGRVHRKKQEDLPKIEFTEKKTYRTEDVWSFHVEKEPHLNRNIWEKNTDTIAPVIRDLARIQQEQSAAAYQGLLRERGFGEVSLEVARYVTRSINSLKDRGPLFEDAEQKNITFFDEVIRVIEFQKLSHLGEEGFGGDNNAQWLKNMSIASIGFLLVPRNAAERELQQTYLRRLETDPMLWFDERFSMELSELPADGSVSSRYLDSQKRGDGEEEGFVFRSDNLPGLALRERVLVENEDAIQQYMETGDFGGDESPSWFGYCQEKPMKKGQLRDRLFGQKDAIEIMKRMVDTDDRQLDGVEEKMNRLIEVLSGLATHLYRSEAASMAQVKEQFDDQKELFDKNKDKGRWNFFAPIIREYTAAFVDELAGASARFRKRQEEDKKYPYYTQVITVVEGLLWSALRDQFSYQDVLKQVREIKMVQQKKNTQVPDDELRFIADTPEEALAWCVYRPKNRQFDGAFPKLETSSILSYLAQEAKALPAIGQMQKELHAVIKKQKDVNQTVLALALGQLPPYEDFLKGKHALPVPETIRLFRRAAEIYGSEWQHLERFKRLDEQVSLWEWKYANPLFSDTYSARDEDRYGEQKDVSLPVFLEKTLEYQLQGIYQIDQNYLDKQKFSWPLFLQDVYDGQLDMAKIIPHHLDKKGKAQVEQALALLKKRLQEAVADPNNLEKIKGMQPGFFKEFILHEKMKRAGVKTLEEIEPFLDHFTAFTHEGSKRNQLEGIIEQSKKDLVKKRKTALFERACQELGLTDDQIKTMRWAAQFEAGNTTLSDRDIAISVNNVPISHDVVYKKFQELLQAEEDRIRVEKCTPEEDVLVFSDQIIEHEKSKLEIGPVYRLRWAAQPLMEWHGAALEQATSPEESKQLFARVEKIIPEAHPLKDIFVKNQLAMDMWHMLKQSGMNLEAAGFSLKKKTVNIADALKAYPLHADASFLKEYTLFEVDGLLDHADQIPEGSRESIIQAIEAALETRISPDQHPALRRMLFALEQKLRWSQVKKDRKNNPDIFDQYIARIQHFYPQPSLEKDDMLEKIGMDLAYTPAQIKAVWNLRYEEQTRWGTETESLTKKTALEGVERTRMGIAKMDTLDRTQYLLWTLGGNMPLVEVLSSDVSHISLEQRKNALWLMTPTERRHALYELFMGEKGIMQPSNAYDLLSDEVTDEELPQKRQEIANRYRPYGATEDKEIPNTLPRIERPNDRIRYVADNIFEQTFGDQALDPELPNDHPTNTRGRELLHTIFRELFLQQKDPARRTELMVNIVEAIGKNKHEGKSLTPGELMKLLLEQIGVVGVKVAQVLSEQPGLLPESIQKELATLKDQATTFSKRGILAYLEAGGWVNSDDAKMETIGDCIGSASIKQVMEGKTKDGQIVAIKAKRPSIDKNFEDKEKEEVSNSDMAVLKRVLREVEKKGFNVPSFLINEVHNGVFEELSFTHEADNQMAMKASLAKRNASLRVPIGEASVEIPLSISAPLSVSDVLYPTPESTDDIGLMVEQYVRGLSLKQMQDYKRALQNGDETVVNRLREKVAQLYDKTRVKDIEKKIENMDMDMLQAQLAIDVLKQITKDGVFHADLHGGNFYLDFNPFVENGTLHEMRGVFIDLGSTGFSTFDAMPTYQKETAEASFDATEDFRDFITALFTIDIMQEGASRKLALLVKKYAGLNWKEEDVVAVLSKSNETEGRVKSLFYGILEQKGDRPLQPQFRALLKTLATASSHFDKLKSVMLGDNPEALGMTPEAMSELVNFDAIAAA